MVEIKVIGKSATGGAVAQCTRCNTAWHLSRYPECPTCWIRERNNRKKKRKRGRPSKKEGWISIGEQ